MKRSSRKNHSVDNERPPKKIARVSSVNSDARAQAKMMAANLPLENRTCCEDTFKFTGVVLSNFLILKRIFNYLNDEDLNTCLEVSHLWKNVAQHLFIPHYDIQLTNDRDPNYYTNNRDGFYSANQQIDIKQRTYRSNEGNDTKDCIHNFHYGAEKLTEITQAGKVSFSLAVVRYGHFELGKLCNVLPTFGKFVINLHASSCKMRAGSFGRQILKDFPNLRYLRFSDGFLHEGGYEEDFDPLLPQNQLLDLRKIDLTGLTCRTTVLVTLLRTAPNLEEIHNLPLILAQSLVEAQKACFLKSFGWKGSIHEYEIHDETLDSALEKLAQLGPKLSFFSFQLNKWGMSLEDSKPRMLHILRSSCDTLRSLTVVPSVWVSFQGIPPLPSLMQIKIVLETYPSWESVVPRIFPEEVVLLQQFPNVSEIDIYLPENKYMRDFFPENVFSPWGSQIQKLKISLADVCTIELLGRIFPSVNCFGFEMVELPDKLNSTLEAISQAWPEMESVHIKIDGRYIRYWGFRSVRSICTPVGRRTQGCFGYQPSTPLEWKYKPLRGHSLDSALTGIPDDTLVRLKKDSLLRTRPATRQIRKLQAESTIRKLKKLKMLKFDFNDDSEAAKALSTLTLLSHEFGFRFLPELKVVVRTPQKMQILEGIKKTFQHLNVLKIERRSLLIPSSSP